MITLTREEAQQVLDHLQDYVGLVGDPIDFIEILRTRLAQPEPEPVADKYLMKVECTKCGAKQDGILTVNAPPQRVYCSCGDGIVANDGALCGICVSLKKMREWQGLTAYEIQEIHLSNPNWGNFACAIEAKLKEKNI